MKEYSITEIQALMESGELTAKKLTEMFLARIHEIDKNGPKLNSVIEINPEALKIAENLDKERKNNFNFYLCFGGLITYARNAEPTDIIPITIKRIK